MLSMIGQNFPILAIAAAAVFMIVLAFASITDRDASA